ncbi:GNAT family N-acetyltransferase [Aquabacterium sp.]|uniref:bifunctional helix-turn-helix transcriptional regulator/GNAT family N-acetyltransferase n=1 Tax=Aquabacterium sp. TaxID=1872578 RepID=UPI003784D344
MNTVAPADRVAEQVAALRRFNRFYTQRIGVLHERLHGSGFTLAESRVLWELSHLPAGEPGISAAALARTLDLDPGYLSRLLKAMKARKLLRLQPAPGDARQQLLSLSAAGRRAFAPVDAGSQAQMAEVLASVPAVDQPRLLAAMQTIEHLLGGRQAERPPYTLRHHRPGDIGWVIARHGALYAEEFQWDIHFEALVAHIAAEFLDRFDARREACWIAERPGAGGQAENIGCVFLVQARDDATGAPDAGVGQLRLLLIEPSARGLGLGARLVSECTQFARRAGYRKLRLWTQSNLLAARTLYRREGYQLVGTEPHHSFGHDLVGEIWEMPLG